MSGELIQTGILMVVAVAIIYMFILLISTRNKQIRSLFIGLDHKDISTVMNPILLSIFILLYAITFGLSSAIESPSYAAIFWPIYLILGLLGALIPLSVHYVNRQLRVCFVSDEAQKAEEQIKKIAEWEHKEYNSKDPLSSIDHKGLLSWHKKNNDGCILFYDNEALIGVMSFWPLTEECFKKLEAGKLKEHQIDRDCIHSVKLDPKEHQYWYIGDIILEESYRKLGFGSDLFWRAYEKWSKNLVVDGEITLCASAASLSGVSMLVGSGFHCDSAKVCEKKKDHKKCIKDKDKIGHFFCRTLRNKDRFWEFIEHMKEDSKKISKQTKRKIIKSMFDHRGR